MRLGKTKLQMHPHVIGAIILLGGLGSSRAIYLTAANDSGGVLGYEMVGGEVYEISRKSPRSTNMTWKCMQQRKIQKDRD
jgi:hypothetical protein